MKKPIGQPRPVLLECCTMPFIGVNDRAPRQAGKALPAKSVSVGQDVVLEVRRLSKRFRQPRQLHELFRPPSQEHVAVRDVNLAVNRGELFGLVGPNGAGKTTLIKMLTTLIAPTSGTILIDGIDIGQETAVKKMLGLATSDERSFYWRLSGRQNLRFFAALHGLSGDTAKERIDRVLKQVQLHEVADNRFSSYSTGMKQRLAIARALVTQPKIVFLDEPTKGLDPASSHKLHRLIREHLIDELGLTVILTSHQLVEVEELCDRIAIMNKGRIEACGTMAELQNLIGSVEKYRIEAREIGPQHAAEIAGGDPEIRVSIGASGSSFEFAHREGDDRLEQIIRAIFEKSGRIKTISREQIPLAAIFSQLTGDGADGRRRAGQGDIRAASPEAVQTAPPESSHPPRARAPRNAGSRLESPLAGGLGGMRRILSALVRRDMLSETSYRFSLFMQIVEIVLTICALFFLSRLLGEDAINRYLKMYGGDYFAFAIIGVGFFKYFNVGYSSFASKLSREQMSGTLEAMLASPAPLSLLVLGGSAWDFIMTTVRVGVFLLAGTFVGGSSLGGGNYMLALFILVLLVVSSTSFGIVAACFIMVVKRGDPISWLFKSSSFLLGGVVFPVAVLPEWMQNLAGIVPTTHALKAMRLALLQNYSFSQLVPEIMALCVFCFVLLPLSLVALGYSVRLAKREGTLTHY